MSILIVEDDEGVRDCLCELLRDEGYDVEAVGDGDQALVRLAQDPLPCLILLDLMMPHMSGLELRRRQLADERLREIPVILISAWHDGPRLAELLGVDDYIAKPMSYEELLHAIQNRAVTRKVGFGEAAR